MVGLQRNVLPCAHPLGPVYKVNYNFLNTIPIRVAMSPLGPKEEYQTLVDPECVDPLWTALKGRRIQRECSEKISSLILTRRPELVGVVEAENDPFRRDLKSDE